MRHFERHRADRIGWLRAAVLGANDGIVSTASLVVGVAAATPTRVAVITAGLAGLVAGAVSMAAGEYVSVQSQADTEEASLATERKELATDSAAEQLELTKIYMKRGLDEDLAGQVAAQLMVHDALGAHARDELGIVDSQRARPVVAALTSAATFAVGALIPLLVAWFVPMHLVPALVVGTSVGLLAVLGATAAAIGGARTLRASARVAIWGALAMGLTYGVGRLFGATVV